MNKNIIISQKYNYKKQLNEKKKKKLLNIIFKRQDKEIKKMKYLDASNRKPYLIL